ncbi:chrd superfamily protein [Stemphylium lycopersici]|nr:chrd superfamily protein [Stemphylium lycopersici]RAR05462.1 chrd superfamily protein [Stemphylium lycopersici]
MYTTILSIIASLVLSATAAPLTTSPLALGNGHVQLQFSIDLGNPNAINTNAFDANRLFTFSSTHLIHAVPEEVVNGTEPTGGLPGTSGTFNFGINSAANMICYNITLHNFQGEFDSPATTATHIHEAARGASGPPRIAFPNPEPIEGDVTVRNSVGCLKGPFTTGVMVEGKDSGEGFHVSMIEADPVAFMADTHSSLALPGAVRGQLA